MTKNHPSTMTEVSDSYKIRIYSDIFDCAMRERAKWVALINLQRCQLQKTTTMSFIYPTNAISKHHSKKLRSKQELFVLLPSSTSNRIATSNLRQTLKLSLICVNPS